MARVLRVFATAARINTVPNAAFAVQILLIKAAKVVCAMPAMKHPGCALFAARLRVTMTVTAITAIRISGITAVAAAEPGRHTGPRTAFARIAGIRVKHKAKQPAPPFGGAGFTCTEVSNFSLAGSARRQLVTVCPAII